MLFDQVIIGLAIGASYSLIGIGFSMMFRSIGLLNFAHPHFMMIGAMVGYSLAVSLGFPMWIVVPGAAVAAGLVALGVEVFGLTPLRRRGSPQVNQIISTIGWGIILSNAAMLLWGPYPLAYPQNLSGKTFYLGAVQLSTQNALIFGTGIVVMLLLQGFYSYTSMGLAMRATADDPEIAMLMGVKPDLVRRMTFFLSGALGGVAGAFIGSLFFASFDLGTFGMRAFSASVLGGFGNVIGAMFGGLALGVIETLGATYISSAYKDVIAFGLVILILLLRPDGLFNFGRRRVV